MRGSWLHYLIGALIAGFVAFIAKFLPEPLSTIGYYGGIIVAVVFLVLMLVALISPTNRGRL